jgi:uncharacterized protein
MNKFLFSLCMSIVILMLSSCASKDKSNASVKSPEVAAEELKVKAQKQDTVAQYQLAYSYHAGRGVKKDEKEAAKWYRKSAEQGFAAAQYRLGLMYENGIGVVEDAGEAAKWQLKAAEQGFAAAQVDLGMMYVSGKGVLQDNKEAIKWFTKAAQQGDALAQYNLVLMYAKGEGVQNYVEAYKWALLAGMNGQDVTKTKVFLKERMTAEQVTQAQKLAKAFADEYEKNSKPADIKRPAAPTQN